MSEAPRRRTQEERRTTTRNALLDATVACLIEHGYAGTTTIRVVERAGVSRGAQVHHYPTRAALVAAAIEHLADRRIAEARLELVRPAEAPLPVPELLDRLWELHDSPMFAAALELWVAARTDAELREHLVAVERTVTHAIVDLTREVMVPRSSAAPTPADTDVVNVVLSTMRGLALITLTTGVDRPAVARHWLHTRGVLERLMTD